MSESTEIEPVFVTKSVAEVVGFVITSTAGNSIFFDGFNANQVNKLIRQKCLMLSLIGKVRCDADYVTAGWQGYAIYCYCRGEICVRCISAKDCTIEKKDQIIAALLRKLIGEGRPYVHLSANANNLRMLNLLKSLGLKACGTYTSDETEFYYMTNNPDEVFRIHD